MVGEAEQEGSVLRREGGVQEGAQVLFVRLEKGTLAAADVHHQPERQRHVLAGGEEGDLLRNAIFQHFEIALRKAGDQFPAAVADGKADVDQVHVGAEVGLCQAERWEQAHGHPELHNLYYATLREAEAQSTVGSLGGSPSPRQHPLASR
jgi:hypothetical protein